MVILMSALPPLHTTGFELTTVALGVGSTITVVTTGVPSGQSTIFGVTVYVTVITELLLLVNVPPMFWG